MTSRAKQSRGVFPLHVTTEWQADPMSPGVYYRCTSLQNHQQAQWLLACILSVGHYRINTWPNWILECIISLAWYRITSRPNESWGVFSMYRTREWQPEPNSLGVYSPVRPYRITSRPNESWGLFSSFSGQQISMENICSDYSTEHPWWFRAYFFLTSHQRNPCLALMEPFSFA